MIYRYGHNHPHTHKPRKRISGEQKAFLKYLRERDKLMSANFDRLTASIAALKVSVDALGSINPGSDVTEAMLGDAATAIDNIKAVVDAKAAGVPLPTDPNPLPGESVAEAKARIEANEAVRVGMARKASTRRV